MMANILMCTYCKLKLDAFLDGELPVRKRQRVAAHLDHCESCYEVYVQRRALRRELEQALPLVGQHPAPDFVVLWGKVRTELPRRQRPRKFRYGLVMLMLLLAMVVPLTMGNGELARALPEQPVPHNQPATHAPEQTEPAPVATVVAASTRPGHQIRGTAPPTLPEPKLNLD